MNPNEETMIKAMIYGTLAAAAIILHNLFTIIYPYIRL